MKYKMQILGWFAAGVLSLATGYIKNASGNGNNFVYIGIAALLAAAIIYYITNRTNMVETLIEKSKQKSAVKDAAPVAEKPAK